MSNIYYALLPFLSGTMILFLGIILYRADPGLYRNRSISIMCAGLAIWLYCYTINYLFPDKPTLNLFLGKISYFGVTLIPLMYLHFTVSFLNIKNSKYIIFVNIMSAVFIALALFTNLIVSGMRSYFWGPYPVAGLLHPIYVLFVVSAFVYCLVNLYNAGYGFRRKDFSTADANRIKYVFWAFLLGNMGSIDFIQNYGYEFYPFGALNITMLVAVITYAIVRHKLMEIEVIIRKTLVFAGLLAFVLAMFILPTLLIQDYVFRRASFSGKIIGLTISGIIMILTMRKIENFLINITDKYLFQKKVSYKDLLKSFTSDVLTVLNLDELANSTVNELVAMMKIDSCAVLLYDDEKECFYVKAFKNIENPFIMLPRPGGIVTFFDETHGYLSIKDFKEKDIVVPSHIMDVIKGLNAELIMPLVLHDSVIGMLALGKKKSDEEYAQDDIDILLPLVRTLAIAISNAELFDKLGKTQAEAAQKEKMAVIGTLSAGINHEICNPLGIARGQCEVFLLNIKDGLYDNKTSEELLEKAKEILQKVIKETDRATAITKKLSSFAKPAKGEVEVVNVAREIDEVLGLVTYELKLDKIDVEKNVEAEMSKALTDRKQFQEALFNLIRNAAQAIGEKGRIIITAKEDNQKIVIDIKDSGSGIPPDKIKQLFNPFFTTKEPGKGTGLGLFIVRQVVEKNGGRIYLKETGVGQGTTFTLEFPAYAPQEAKV